MTAENTLSAFNQWGGGGGGGGVLSAFGRFYQGGCCPLSANSAVEGAHIYVCKQGGGVGAPFGGWGARHTVPKGRGEGHGPHPPPPPPPLGTPMTTVSPPPAFAIAFIKRQFIWNQDRRRGKKSGPVVQ